MPWEAAGSGGGRGCSPTPSQQGKGLSRVQNGEGTAGPWLHSLSLSRWYVPDALPRGTASMQDLWDRAALQEGRTLQSSRDQGAQVHAPTLWACAYEDENPDTGVSLGYNGTCLVSLRS